MKILIWLLCALVYGVANAVLQEAGMLLGGMPTALLCLALGGLAVFLCRAWDKRKAKEAPDEQPAADMEAPKKNNRPASRITCIVLAVCVIAMSVGLVVCIDEYQSLERAYDRLSSELAQIEQDAEWDTDLEGRRQALLGLDEALQRFFYSYGDRAWEELSELLEQFS